MDNFIIENLEYSDFSDSFDTENYKNKDLIKNWLFVYMVKNQNINEACFSKDLLANAYEKVFEKELDNIDNLFNETEITDNYVCYSKKNSDIKEYKYKEAKNLKSNNEGNLISYYQIEDNKNETYYIGIRIDKTINSIYSYNEYKENNIIKDIIKDREFNKQTEVGESYSGSGFATVNYLKEKGSYELENEEIITLNNGKLTFKQKNNEETVPVKNIKEVVLDGEGMTQNGKYEIYFLDNSGEVYYYDEIPYEGEVNKEGKNINVTLKETIKNYKKINLDKKAKNFVFRRNEINKNYKVLEILLKLEDNTMYSIKNNKVVDYLLSSTNNISIFKNNNVEKDSNEINYKFKSVFDMESFIAWGSLDYFITQEDYLYDTNSNKLITNSKIDKIYKSNEESCDYSYLITFENKETFGLEIYRCF